MAQSILDPIFSGSTGIAKTLINLMGGDASILPPPSVSYDPLTGDEVETPATAVSVDIAALEEVSEADVRDTSVLRGDFKCLVPESDITLDPTYIQGGILTFNGIDYIIVEYMPVHSGQNVAMYTVYLRRV